MGLTRTALEADQQHRYFTAMSCLFVVIFGLGWFGLVCFDLCVWFDLYICLVVFLFVWLVCFVGWFVGELVFCIC